MEKKEQRLISAILNCFQSYNINSWMVMEWEINSLSLVGKFNKSDNDSHANGMVVFELSVRLPSPRFISKSLHLSSVFVVDKHKNNKN